MSDVIPLPFELLIDVLTRLPIKSLVCCACVCKSWYNLITSPLFITTHLNRSSLANNNNLLLVRSCSIDDKEENYSLLSCENEMFYGYAEFELPIERYENPYLRIIGTCNGLLCLSDDSVCYMFDIYLWNPSIQKMLALPPVRLTFESHGDLVHSMGFGFDSLTNDYKVIRIVYFEGPFGCQSPPEVDIFSLSTGIWRNISHLGLQYTIYPRAPQAFLNGAAHWPAYDWRRRVNLIVSFHMGDEVFGEMMVPDSLVHHNWLQGVRVAKFQESLALIHIKRTDDNNTCCIWVMKEYGIPESWTKLFSIDTGGGLFTNVAGFTRRGEVLFGTKDGYLVAYDPEVEQVKHLHVRGSTDSWYRDSFYADAFTESLVLIRENEPPVLHG